MRQQASEDLAFRDDVRAFLHDALQDDLAQRGKLGQAPTRDDYLRWASILSTRGWSVPTWPVEHGGAGWSARQRQIFEEESLLAGAPPIHIQSVYLVGPLIARFGSEAQKQSHLPAIKEGRELWCQGFSEPGSGSDLASLRTRARRDGDMFVVNGQKIWTSDAILADHIFCLVRTDNGVEQHRGISMLLFSLKTPGVTVRPIPMIGDAPHHLCEVFFEDVHVPATALLGAEGAGWEYARWLLSNERTTTAEVGRNRFELNRLRSIVNSRHSGKKQAEHYRLRLTELEINLLALESANSSNLASLDVATDRPTASVLKVQGTELLQAIQEASLQALGPDGIILRDLESDPSVITNHVPGLTGEFLFRRAMTIAGGTTEILMMIIGRWLARADALLPHPLLSEEQCLIRDSIRQHLERTKDGGATDSNDDWPALISQGWLALDLAETAGGLGYAAADAAVVVEEFGRKARADSLTAGRACVWTLALIEGADAENRLKELLAGKNRRALAHLEAEGHGAVETVNTQLRRAGNRYVLNGQKDHVLGIDGAQTLLVSARTESGTIRLIDVPVGVTGIRMRRYRTIDHKIGANIAFDDVEIRPEMLIETSSDVMAGIEKAYDRIICDACSELVGLAEGAFWLTRDYLRDREQFGRPLIEFQALQHRLARMYVEVDRARAASLLARTALEEENLQQRQALLSAAKSVAGRSAYFVGAQAMQLHGGISQTREYPVGSYFTRICATNALYGDPQYHLQRYADLESPSTGGSSHRRPRHENYEHSHS
jgi:acyl-CoA dehydrogenase